MGRWRHRLERQGRGIDGARGAGAGVRLARGPSGSVWRVPLSGSAAAACGKSALSLSVSSKEYAFTRPSKVAWRTAVAHIASRMPRTLSRPHAIRPTIKELEKAYTEGGLTIPEVGGVGGSWKGRASRVDPGGGRGALVRGGVGVNAKVLLDLQVVERESRVS